jgi:hypothetical protein
MHRKHRHKRTKRSSDNVMAVHVHERIFHIPTRKSMAGGVKAKESWQDTLCGVKVRFRLQNMDWDWCKKCLTMAMDGKGAVGVGGETKTKKQQAHRRITVMAFQPSAAVIELIGEEMDSVNT